MCPPLEVGWSDLQRAQTERREDHSDCPPVTDSQISTITAFCFIFWEPEAVFLTGGELIASL